jgi:hypothetical protein
MTIAEVSGKRVKRLEIVEKEAVEEKHWCDVCHVIAGLPFVST